MYFIKRSVFVETKKRRQHVVTFLDILSLIYCVGCIVRPSLQYNVDVILLCTTHVFDVHAKELIIDN